MRVLKCVELDDQDIQTDSTGRVLMNCGNVEMDNDVIIYRNQVLKNRAGECGKIVKDREVQP